MGEKLSGLWTFIQFIPQEKQIIKRRFKKLRKESPLQIRIKQKYDVSGYSCFILKMYTENPIKKSSYISFLNKVHDASPTRSLDYIYGKRNREITKNGKRFLKREDIPLAMSLYLLFVKQGYPYFIIKRTGQFDFHNLKYIDDLCLKEGYVARV